MKEGVDELCAFLASEKNGVEGLDLAYNNLGAEFGAAVLAALGRAPQRALRVLDLSMNHLGGTDSGEYEDAALPPLCELLAAVPLQSLKLQWNFLQAQGAGALATALGGDMPCKHLRCLDVSRNYLAPVGVDAVCAAISDAHAVAELRIAANGRCAAAAPAVAAMVARARSLRVLDAADLALGTDGGRQLFDAVGRSGLQHVFAAKNEIGAGAAAGLGGAIASCGALRCVDAGDNDFGSASIAADVLPRLRSNSTLRSLTVWGGEHGTPPNPTKLALAQKTAQLLAAGGGSALLYLDLALPVALRGEEAVGKVTESLFGNLAAATFGSPDELLPLWGGA